MSLYCNYSCVTTCSKEIELQGQGGNQRASDRLRGDGQAVALSTRSYYQHQQHPPKLAVRGNQIDIMLVTVEKRTYVRLGAKLGYCGFGASMSDGLYIISAFSDPVVTNRPFSCVM